MMNAIACSLVALAALCFWKVLDVGRPYERQWLRWLPNFGVRR